MLLKLTDEGRNARVLIMKNSINDIIEAGKIKLNLPEENEYKLCLDEDGTEIEDFELLEALAQASKDVLVLMLRQRGSNWLPFDAIDKQKLVNADPAPVGPTSATVPPSYSQEPEKCALPWDKVIPLNFKNHCLNNNADMLTFIRNVADYMIHNLNDTSLKTAERLASDMFSKFPNAFRMPRGDLDGGEVEKSAQLLEVEKSAQLLRDAEDIKCLKMRIYDACRYKIDAKREKRFKLKRSQAGVVEPQKHATPYGRKEDSHGCVAYEPPLPCGETKSNQNEKKERLINLFKEGRYEDTEVKQLIMETYPTQRFEINHRNDSPLKNILVTNWPHMMVLNNYVDHACILTGKNCRETFRQNMNNKIENLFEFFHHVSISNTKKENLCLCLGEIKQALDLCIQLRSKTPKSLCVFKVLSYWFDEDQIFKCVDPALPIEEVKNIGDSRMPLLIFKGHSIYEEKCQWAIVVEEDIVLESNTDVLEGILSFTLFHFVYGYNYAPKMALSLEFIQRMFLNINPNEMHAGKKMKYDSRVKKVIKNFALFNRNLKM